MVVAFTTCDYLMLDVDMQPKGRVVSWTRKYAKKFGLGNVLITKTSDSYQLDLFGRRLYNFGIIFGRYLPSWGEKMYHIENAFKARIVNKGFMEMRYLGSITERWNAKSDKVSYPKPFRYIRNSGKSKDREGIIEYLRHWYLERVIADFPSVHDEDDEEEGLEGDELDPIDTDPLDREQPKLTNVGLWQDRMCVEAERLARKRNDQPYFV